jgi:IclR family acetate operon transcriptional repressor
MKSKDVSVIQSLARGIEGLEMASREGSVRPADLAKRLRTNRSTAYRLLSTLERLGYLFQSDENKGFYLNYEKLRSLMPDAWNWANLADPCVRKLSQQTNAAANLGVIQNMDVIYIKCVKPDSPLSDDGYFSTLTPGLRRPVYITALGKAILAFQDDFSAEYLKNVVGKTSKKYPLDSGKLLAHLGQIRTNKYAIDDEDLIKGVRCIAAPIFDSRRKVAAAIGVAGTVDIITMQKLPALAQQVILSANGVSALLQTAGYVFA